MRAMERKMPPEKQFNSESAVSFLPQAGTNFGISPKYTTSRLMNRTKIFAFFN